MSERYEYLVVSVDNENDWQKVLDQHARNGWRLAQTIISDGYTTKFIFERQIDRVLA